MERAQKYPGNVSKKIPKDIRSRTGDIPICFQFQKESKPPNILTDIQEICNHVELVYKHPGNVSKGFKKYILSRTGDIQIFL